MQTKPWCPLKILFTHATLFYNLHLVDIKKTVKYSVDTQEKENTLFCNVIKGAQKDMVKVGT